MAKRKDALRIKELNGGSKKTEKVEKINQEVQEQQVKNELKKAQSQTAEDVNSLLDGPSEEEDVKRLAELKKAIKELDEKADKADKANKADDGAKPTAAQLEAEVQRRQKAIEDGEKAFEAKKAKGLAEVERLKAEAKKLAAEEEKARLAAIEAAKAEEAKKAAEAKKAEEAAKAEKEAAEAVCNPGPKKVYQYRSSKTKETHTTSDIWAAEQAAPGNWKAIWVWVGSNGKIHHVLTPEEIAEFVQ